MTTCQHYECVHHYPSGPLPACIQFRGQWLCDHHLNIVQRQRSDLVDAHIEYAFEMIRLAENASAWIGPYRSVLP